MFRFFRLITVAAVALTFIAVTNAAAQARGFELFRTMLGSQLARTTGTTRVTWLPGGMGYLERARDSASGGQKFFKVDPATGSRAPLFDPGTEA
ncbi:MAG: hypothetical protein ABI647_26330, partial [Gemmatimonadota bacterium]